MFITTHNSNITPVVKLDASRNGIVLRDADFNFQLHMSIDEARSLANRLLNCACEAVGSVEEEA